MCVQMYASTSFSQILFGLPPEALSMLQQLSALQQEDENLRAPASEKGSVRLTEFSLTKRTAVNSS